MRLAVIASHPVQYYAPLFRTLARRLDVTVFYAHRASPADQAKAGFSVQFHWDVDLLNGYKSRFLTNVAGRPSLGSFTGVDTPEIGRRLQEGEFDAVLIMGWYLKCFLQALIASKRAGIPVLARGDSQLETPRSALKTAAKAAIYPFFLRQFDAALIVGERNRSYWLHYGYPANRMFEAPHCVDTAWFAARATPQERDTLRSSLGVARETRLALFAGKLVEFKRPLDLIEAAALSRRNGLAMEILVAGAGPLENALRDRAADLAVPLHLLGFCNQTRMPQAYAASDILILPSTGRETWGLVVNEALACRRPILVSDAAGCAPDIVKHLGGGAVFPMGNILALANKQEATLLDAPILRDIDSASIAFSLEAAAAGIYQAVTELKRKKVVGAHRA